MKKEFEPVRVAFPDGSAGTVPAEGKTSPEAPSATFMPPLCKSLRLVFLWYSVTALFQIR